MLSLDLYLFLTDHNIDFFKKDLIKLNINHWKDAEETKLNDKLK